MKYNNITIIKCNYLVITLQTFCEKFFISINNLEMQLCIVRYNNKDNNCENYIFPQNLSSFLSIYYVYVKEL